MGPQNNDHNNIAKMRAPQKLQYQELFIYRLYIWRICSRQQVHSVGLAAGGIFQRSLISVNVLVGHSPPFSRLFFMDCTHANTTTSVCSGPSLHYLVYICIYDK